MASDVIYGYEIATRSVKGKRVLQLSFGYKFRNEDRTEGRNIESFVLDDEAIRVLKKAIAEVENRPRIGFR